MTHTEKKQKDLEKIKNVVFSCETIYHLFVAEKMFDNWCRMYSEDNDYIDKLIRIQHGCIPKGVYGVE